MELHKETEMEHLWLKPSVWPLFLKVDHRALWSLESSAEPSLKASELVHLLCVIEEETEAQTLH